MAKKSNKKGRFVQKKRPVQNQAKKTIEFPVFGKLVAWLKKWPFILPVLLTLLYYSVFQAPAKLDDSCFIGGDTWEYHAMGVNLAKGHGINKFGAFEPYETYKFTFGDERKVASFKKRQRNNFLRTPGYSMFLGLVYKIFGVDVSIVKMLQLLMIAFIAGFMPLLGNKMAGPKGYLTGLISGPFIMMSSYRMSEALMTEAITAFAIFFICLTMANAFKKPNWLNGALLGLAIGWGLLIKGALIFIPMLLFAFYLIQFLRSKSTTYLQALGGMLLIAGMIVFAWSSYASAGKKKRILLSTQSRELLLDCNNPLAIDGVWHPEWRKDRSNPDLYYHTQKRLKKKSSLQKVIQFYKEYPQNIVPTFKNKLYRGFSPFPYLWLFCFCLLIQLIKQFCNKNKLLDTSIMALGLVGFFILAFIISQDHLHRFVEDGNIYGASVVPNWVTSAGLIFMAGAGAISAFQKDHKFLGVPTILYFILANFILLILVFWGSVRFVKVTDFLFVYMALLLPVSWIVDQLKASKYGKALMLQSAV